MEFFQSIFSFVSILLVGVASLAAPTITASSVMTVTPTATPSPTPAISADLLLFDALFADYPPAVLNQDTQLGEKLLVFEANGYDSGQVFIIDEWKTVYSVRAEWYKGAVLYTEKTDYDYGADIKVFVDRTEANYLLDKFEKQGTLYASDVALSVASGKTRIEPSNSLVLLIK